jgi:hypothetical protein
MGTSRKRGFPAPLIAGAVVVLLFLGMVYVATEKTREPLPIEQPMLLREEDRDYVQQIELTEIRMMRSTNMLGQEIIYILGTAKNGGARKILDLEVTIEFRDFMNQVVLRDRLRLFGRNPDPLSPGQSREFTLSFESVPSGWNRNYPEIRVTGLRLEPGPGQAPQQPR